MAYFTQQLINGLTLGSIYGLIAIGYTMVYGIIGMINFAHGEIYMLGAFIAIITFLLLGLAGVTFMPLVLLLVLILSMAFTAVYGWTLERLAYRPLRGAPRLAPLISAIGMSIFLQNYVQILQGARVKPIQPVLTGGMVLAETGGFAVTLSYLQLIIIVLTVVLMVAFSFLIGKTKLGRAQRACEQDRAMAALVGVNVDKTIALTFVMGAALAAVAGRDGDAVLGRDRFLHRLPGRSQSIYRSRARRHRLAARPPCWAESSSASSRRSGRAISASSTRTWRRSRSSCSCSFSCPTACSAGPRSKRSETMAEHPLPGGATAAEPSGAAGAGRRPQKLAGRHGQRGGAGGVRRLDAGAADGRLQDHRSRHRAQP